MYVNGGKVEVALKRLAEMDSLELVLSKGQVDSKGESVIDIVLVGVDEKGDDDGLYINLATLHLSDLNDFGEVFNLSKLLQHCIKMAQETLKNKESGGMRIIEVDRP